MWEFRETDGGCLPVCGLLDNQLRAAGDIFDREWIDDHMRAHGWPERPIIKKKDAR